MNRRPHRIRSVMKWAGLVVCVGLLPLWAISLRVHHFAVIRVHHGGVVVTDAGFHVGVWGENLGREIDLSIRGLPSRRLWLPQWGTMHLGRHALVFVPGWLAFLLLAVPTIILWRRDRRRPEGCCQNCGYDLTGEVSGLCPKCGDQMCDPQGHRRPDDAALTPNGSKKRRGSILRMKIPVAMLFFIVFLVLLIVSHLNRGSVWYTRIGYPYLFVTRPSNFEIDQILARLGDGAVLLEWDSYEQKVARPPVSRSATQSLIPAGPLPIDMVFFRLDRRVRISLSFGQTMITNYEESTENILRIRILPLFLLTAAWLTVSILRSNRRRREHDKRKRHSLCVKCAYSLRGNQTGVCPECGTET